MKKRFVKILKNATDLTSTIKDLNNIKYTEEDLDILAEAIDLFTDAYDKMYDKVFIKSE